MSRVGVPVALLLAACVGCVLPKSEPLRPAAVWDRLRGANPDGYVVRTVLVEAPAGDAALNGDLWAQAGRPLPHELATLLGGNGLRVGKFAGAVPAEFDRLLKSPHAALDATDRSFAAGKAKVVPVNGPLPRLTFRELTDLSAEPTPCDLSAAECGFAVTAGPAAGGVKLTFEPQAQHGDKQLFLRPASDGATLAREDRKPLKLFPALAFEATLGPKECLIIGPTADPAETLGGGFFLSTANDRVRQRVLVIWAAKRAEESAK